MPRRVTVPDDLFRPTAVPSADRSRDRSEPTEASVVELPASAAAAAASGMSGPAAEPGDAKPVRAASGRVKHDEKMTVYVTSDELLDIEHARLEMRRHHGLAVDRGRIVRAAVALALADLDEHGEDSRLVQRLRQA